MQMSSNQAEQACGVIIQSVLNLPGRTGLERRASFSRLTESSFFASKLYLTGIFSAHRICVRRRSKNVGVSLLAMAVGQAPGMLAVAASSRAGSLPQGFSAPTGSAFGGDQNVGVSLLAMAVGQAPGMLAVAASSRAGSLPQGLSAHAGSAFGGDQKMWERACSRWRSVRRQGCWLWRPHREQARSHKYFQRPQDLRSAGIKMWE